MTFTTSLLAGIAALVGLAGTWAWLRRDLARLDDNRLALDGAELLPFER
jgi:hypothetical protein